MSIGKTLSKRELAIQSLKAIQNKGFYSGVEFEEKEKTVWFCVLYDNPRSDLNSEKDYVKRLLKGEKIKGTKDKLITMTLGYGKLLAINREKNTSCKNGILVQYIVYDTVCLVGKERGNYSVFHEAWVNLGAWAKHLAIEKELVVFT